MKKIMVGNHAVSWGVMLARAEVISAYPITPQTTIVEELSVLCADGRLKARFIPVESEHSAMACCIGSSAAGVRTFTATSSQGLALMHEMLHWASGARLPIVMANVNRALGSPFNIWGEQSDSLAQRDTGWLQIYCESNQEVLDTVLQAFKIAEQVLLPVMLVLDAFILSHTAEPVDIPDQKLADDFLPPYRPDMRLNSKDPRIFACLAPPEYLMEFRYKIQQAMLQSKEVCRQVDEEFGRTFGRKYGVVEPYRCDGADLILVTAGSITSTARVAVDALRDKGRKVGLVKLRLFRPFPKEELLDIVRGADKIAVLDRNLSAGIGGIFAHEIRAAFCNEKERPPIYSYIGGLGGRDITLQTLNEVVYQTYERSRPEEASAWVGLTCWKGAAMREGYESTELMYSGHLACAGCGATIAMRYALKALGDDTVIILPACCWSIIGGPFPYAAVKVPLIHTAFETGASTASGVKAGLEMRGDPDTTVAAWVGDGGTFDIGIQALSGAAERNDDIIYFCYDNEAYMNTGIQRSSATPWGTWTTTTPSNYPKGQPKKNMMEIMAAHRIPYAATCSVAFPEDMIAKIQKAKSIRGTKFIHIFSPCPTGWKAPSSLAVKIARLAVHTKVFPLYEVEGGLRYHINVNPKNLPVDEYLRLQGRFNHLSDEAVQKIQETVDWEWEHLLKKALDTI